MENSDTMKALVKYASGSGNMEIRDMPVPHAGPGQIKIKVMEAGICGSDLHIYHSDIAIPINPPVITGHEFSGIVEDVYKRQIYICSICAVFLIRMIRGFA